MMKSGSLFFGFLLWATLAFGQTPTFTFECFCGYLTAADSNCDICTSVIQSRFFKGILIKKDGAVYRWIEEPYTVKFSGNVATFVELIPNPEQIRINRLETPYGTLDSFKSEISCPCAGADISIAVDTPIIGDGTPGNPITIGQFGADTLMFLKWSGSHWLPARVTMDDVVVNLPYFKNDDSAITGGLILGDVYLLDTANTYALPTGLFKVVQGCGVTCAVALKYFINDPAAISSGVPVGFQYLLDEQNKLGLWVGFVKLVTGNSIIPDGTLACDTTTQYFVNDPAAITGGLVTGELYAMASANTYGSPVGIERAVSSISSTSADPPKCCDETDYLPFYSNDTAAITGGLGAGNWYYLSETNTLGFPYGTKKQVQ